MFLRHQRLETVSSSVFVSREKERRSQSSFSKRTPLKCVSSVLAALLLFFTLFAFSIIPLEFCHAVGTPSYWDSRVYPMGLVDEGSTEAGIKGFANEYGFFSTSQWTQFAFDLKSGGLVCQANLIQIPGTSL